MSLFSKFFKKAEESKASSTPWYSVTNKQKHVTQVVFDIPQHSEKDPKFGTILLNYSRFRPLLENTFGAGLFYLDSEPGPFLMIRGDRIVTKLKGSKMQMAVCFYRMDTGGLFIFYLYADCPAVAKMLTHPLALFESSAYGLDERPHLDLFERAIDREHFHLCFVEGDAPSRPDGYGVVVSSGLRSMYDIVIPLDDQPRSLLKSEYKKLLEYHHNIPSSRRDYRNSIQQLWAENPQGINPIIAR